MGPLEAVTYLSYNTFATKYLVISEAAIAAERSSVVFYFCIPIFLKK